MSIINNIYKNFLATICVLIAITAGINSASADSAKNWSKEDLEKVIGEYIMSNPEVLLQSVQQMQVRQEQERLQKAQENIKLRKSDLENDPLSPYVGNPNAEVTLVEFFDYNCGYCKMVLPTVNKIIDNNPNVKVVFKEFPILSESSELAARYALAVNKLNKDKYLEFHSQLMKKGSQKDEASIHRILSNIGIDVEDAKKLINSAGVDNALSKNKELARAIGIGGTPAFVVNNKLIPGAANYEALMSEINAALGKK